MKDDPSKRQTPPETPEEWAYIWKASERAHMAWVVVGPVYAFVTNWKFLVAGILFLLWINRPEVLAALSVLMGVK